MNTTTITMISREHESMMLAAVMMVRIIFKSCNPLVGEVGDLAKTKVTIQTLFIQQDVHQETKWLSQTDSFHVSFSE